MPGIITKCWLTHQWRQTITMTPQRQRRAHMYHLSVNAVPTTADRLCAPGTMTVMRQVRSVATTVASRCAKQQAPYPTVPRHRHVSGGNNMIWYSYMYMCNTSYMYIVVYQHILHVAALCGCCEILQCTQPHRKILWTHNTANEKFRYFFLSIIIY